MPKKLPKKVKQVWESKLEQDYENNLHISYSSLTKYATCPRMWQALKLTKEVPEKPSIHMTFGTAVHETIQSWLEVLYHKKVKEANEMDLDALLYSNMIKAYQKDKERNNNEDFTDSTEMQKFYVEGTHILKFIKSRRAAYFSTKKTFLAGIETLLYYEIQPKVYFKGYIDLVMYDEVLDKWTLVDIKTSTKGWNKYQKADDNKKAQLLLYKHYFSKFFDIPLEKIEVLYFIVKRHVPVDAEYASMQKRVQEFRPAEGSRKMKQAKQLLDTFVQDTVGQDGKFINKQYPTTPSKDACRFCELKKLRLCSDAVL